MRACEFIYVIHGILSVHMNAEEHVLEAGDAIYFDLTIPHEYRRSGAGCAAPSSLPPRKRLTLEVEANERALR